MPHPFGDIFQGSGDHESAVGKAEQHDVAQILVLHGVDDIGDVGGQADLRTGEVRALADAGQAWREDLVTCRAQRAADLPEAGRAALGAVHEDEDRHALIRQHRLPRPRPRLVELPVGRPQPAQRNRAVLEHRRRTGSPPGRRRRQASARTTRPSRRRPCGHADPQLHAADYLAAAPKRKSKVARPRPFPGPLAVVADRGRAGGPRAGQRLPRRPSRYNGQYEVPGTGQPAAVRSRTA